MYGEQVAMHSDLQRAADQASAVGPAALIPGLRLCKPIDAVRTPSVSVDDHREILAASAFERYAVIRNRPCGTCDERPVLS